jgi:chromate transporter
VSDTARAVHVPLRTIAREWTKIGVTGFGGPPTHIALLRRLVVEQRKWLRARELEDAIAACNLLPGPASTQLAIFCAERLSGRSGALVGGLGFILPAVAMVTALAALFLAQSAPAWIQGAGAGAGAAVAAVAAQAAVALMHPSWERVTHARARRVRWIVYVLLGTAAAALLGPYLVLVLLGCGLVELLLRTRPQVGGALTGAPFAAMPVVGGLGALAWVAIKVGALSYGGGFVIVPLMRSDAVHTYHWMSGAQFLSAVALGQITPGPVVATVAAVGYAADGVGGALLAALIAFLPSFMFVMLLGGQFERLRANARAQAFLDGAGPAAIGAILGAAIALTAALTEWWQFLVLGAAAVALLVGKRDVVLTLLAAGTTGAIVGLAGGPLPY